MLEGARKREKNKERESKRLHLKDKKEEKRCIVSIFSDLKLFQECHTKTLIGLFFFSSEKREKVNMTKQISIEKFITKNDNI